MSTELPEMLDISRRPDLDLRDGVMHDASCEYASEACGCESRTALLARIRALDELWDEYADILAADPGEARDTLLLDVGNRLDELREKLRKEGTLP